MLFLTPVGILLAEGEYRVCFVFRERSPPRVILSGVELRSSAEGGISRGILRSPHPSGFACHLPQRGRLLNKCLLVTDHKAKLHAGSLSRLRRQLPPGRSLDSLQALLASPPPHKEKRRRIYIVFDKRSRAFRKRSTAFHKRSTAFQ